METQTIKQNIYDLLDSIQDEAVLQDFYNILEFQTKDRSELSWENLTKEQREEILMSHSQTKDPKKIIDSDNFKKRYNKWL
jgi:hypothetical protein